MEQFKFDDSFKFGTATSSTQIEGGDTNNTWYQWCNEGHIKDSTSTLRACNHWNRVDEDTVLLERLNVQTHRMSLEWSRVEPEPGIFSLDVINHYRKEIQGLIDVGIQPLITLHHFSDPIWFKDMGGWLDDENNKYFIEYVKFVLDNVGDLVSQWVTFNEPNVYSVFGYLIGIFPPGIKSYSRTLGVMTNIIKTHINVYDLIHKTGNRTNSKQNIMVGYAMHIRIFDGFGFMGKKMAEVVDYMFHDVFMEGMTLGKLKFPLYKASFKCSKEPKADFVGINYYTRNILKFVIEPTKYCCKFIKDEKLKKSDLGWDIYPEGIYRVCKKYYNKYKLPIYITENGISDKNDVMRPQFIAEHLMYISKAIQEGIDIRRYYHWTLMDNFEWLEGENGFFGLIKCNFLNQEREERFSYLLYREICRNKEVSENMINTIEKMWESIT